MVLPRLVPGQRVALGVAAQAPGGQEPGESVRVLLDLRVGQAQAPVYQDLLVGHGGGHGGEDGREVETGGH